MAIVNVKDSDFAQAVQKGVVLVDFWAPWCGPCKMLGPVLEELSAKLGDSVTIAKLNVDDNPVTASQFGVMSIPTIKLFKDGVDVSTQVGFRPLADLEAWVNSKLA